MAGDRAPLNRAVCVYEHLIAVKGMVLHAATIFCCLASGDKQWVTTRNLLQFLKTAELSQNIY